MPTSAMKVGTKLAAAFSVLAFMVLIVSGLSLKSLGDADASFSLYVNGISAQANLAENMRNAGGPSPRAIWCWSATRQTWRRRRLW